MANNKYGELVVFHGPVCAKCHQRIPATNKKFPQQNSEPNICDHCVCRVTIAKVEGR